MFHQNNIKYLPRDKTEVGATVVFVEFAPSCRRKDNENKNVSNLSLCFTCMHVYQILVQIDTPKAHKFSRRSCMMINRG